MVREGAGRAAHGLRRPFLVNHSSGEHSLRRKLASPARLETFGSAHQMEHFAAMSRPIKAGTDARSAAFKAEYGVRGVAGRSSRC